MLTQKQIDDVLRIIQDHIAGATYLFTGVVPSGVDIDRLKADGVVPYGTPDAALRNSYLFGMLTATQPELASAPFSEVQAAIAKMPLSELERRVSDWLANSAAVYCAGLGNRMAGAAGVVLYDAAKEAISKEAIRSTLAQGAKDRATRSEIVSRLRESLADAQRDWHRVVNTELHRGATEGVSTKLYSEFGGDVHVIVRPNPDACPVCKKAYLDATGAPKVFRLADLEISNVGRKQADLIAKPGKPPLHPFCHCQLIHFDPATMEVDAAGQVRFKRKT